MKEKVTFWKITVIGIFIFLFGYFVGNVFDMKKVIALEGFEFNALADVGATPCNATSSNATSSNATSCNATSSNTNTNNSNTKNNNVNNNTNSNTKNNNANNNNNNNTNNNTKNNNNTPAQTTNNENISFANNTITEVEIKAISDSTKPLNVTLNCDANSVVSASIFDAIKKSNSKLILVYGRNQMTFAGNNITQSKNIDFKVDLSEIDKNDKLNKFTNSGLVIDFPNNNKLPGDAVVCINIDSKYNNYFTSDMLAVYYYNETTDKLELVAKDLKIINNTVEFALNHNSSFVLTSSTINEENIAKDTNNEVVSFFNNNIIYIVVIGVSIILIVVVIIIVLVQRKKKLGKMF